MTNVVQRTALRIASALCFWALATSTALAFEVQPMRHHIFPANGNAAGQFSVNNQRSDPLPVEIVVLKRSFDENGDIVLVDAEDDFLIFPVQTLIEPNTSQTFRFQYLSDPNVIEETAYTIDVREVPVTLPDEFTGVRVVYNFGIAVYVENADAESELVLDSVLRDDNALNLEISNPTNSFGRLSNDRFVLTQGNNRISLEGSDLKGRVDKIVLAPNAKSQVVLDLEGLDLSSGEIAVRIDDESE